MTIKAKKIFLFVGILTGIVSACLGLETQHTNHLGWALLLAGTAFSSIGAISLGILSFQDARQKKEQDRSLWLPAFGVWLISLIPPVEYLYLPPTLARSDEMQDIGLILFAGGLCFYLLFLHNHEKKDEAALFPASNQKNISFTHWIFRPFFACLLLFTLGLSVGYSSLMGLLIILLILLPGLIYRMKQEDRQF